MKRHIDLTEGSLSGHILRMTPPMTVGFLAMMAFNLSDAWFVSRMGTLPLAAIGYTFPLVMVFHSISMGIGLGAASCVSRAIGQGDHDKVNHLTTYSLLLTLLMMGLLAVIGEATVSPVLRVMGATTPEIYEPAREYMRIWFIFAPFASLPMVGNNAIRSTGDTVRPGIVMASGAILNIILDPIFIFGWKGVPAMGVLTLVLSFCLLRFRYRMLTFQWPGGKELLNAWRSILFVAAPAAATNLLQPITAGLVIRIIAGFGPMAVAATTAGQRIEGFAYLIPMAMGTTLVPIIGQNWGAGRADRVRCAWICTNWYGIIYSVVILLVALFCAPQVAGLFSHDAQVVHLITIYLRILLTGAILLHSTVHTGFAFNAVEKPMHAAGLTAVRLVGFTLPMAWLGSRVAGVPGVYGGMALAYVFSGIVALLWFSRTLRGR
jgi:putative MATE family efflux protein